MMLETVHRLGSRIRHSGLLARQEWLWERVEPHWQRTFARLSERRGYPTRVNGDVFRLEYAYGARYDRFDNTEYEPTIYQEFVQRIRRDMTVFDIGAHIGIFTLGAAKRVGKEGRVYAFEPAPETAAILERHVAFNRWQDRVEVVRAVVSDTNGTVPFHTHGDTMSASLARENVELLSPQQFDTPSVKIELSSVTLDQFCNARNIKPDIIKIDAEGAELLVLWGAKRLLLSEQITILCEIHPVAMPYCGTSLSELYGYLDSIGYCLDPLDEPGSQGVFHSLINRRQS